MTIVFNEVERITELYLKASTKEDPMLEEWTIAVVMRNLPKQITKDLAMELKKATSIDDIHDTTNVHMHDHQTGMPQKHARSNAAHDGAQPRRQDRSNRK